MFEKTYQYALVGGAQALEFVVKIALALFHGRAVDEVFFEIYVSIIHFAPV
jgi:hypothetical protein